MQGIEIGAGLAEKSKGLFSAEDWQCGKVTQIADILPENIFFSMIFIRVAPYTGLTRYPTTGYRISGLTGYWFGRIFG